MIADQERIAVIADSAVIAGIGKTLPQRTRRNTEEEKHGGRKPRGRKTQSGF